MAATPGSEAQQIAQLDHAALCTWFAALDPSDLGRISHDWTKAATATPSVGTAFRQR